MWTQVSGQKCPVTVWADAMRIDVQALQSYRPDQIVAVEWYPRGLQAPARFHPANNANCGILLVWTRFLH